MRRAWPLLLLAVPACVLLLPAPTLRKTARTPRTAKADPIPPVPLVGRSVPGPARPAAEVRPVEIERVEEEEDPDVDRLEARAIDGRNRPVADLPMEVWIDGRTFAVTSDPDGFVRIPSGLPRRTASALACGLYAASTRFEDGRLTFVFETLED